VAFEGLQSKINVLETLQFQDVRPA